jgi:hypothetical protein
MRARGGTGCLSVERAVRVEARLELMPYVSQREGHRGADHTK